MFAFVNFNTTETQSYLKVISWNGVLKQFNILGNDLVIPKFQKKI